MEIRIDKFLWASRIFKTRPLAVEAIRNGRVSMSGIRVKAGKLVKEGDVIEVRKPPVTYTFRILRVVQSRVGAKLLPEILENLTPPDQYELLEMNRISGFVGRAKGTGRPTKKDRRQLDDFIAPTFFGDFEDSDYYDSDPAEDVPPPFEYDDAL